MAGPEDKTPAERGAESAPPPRRHTPAAWGRPLARLDGVWTAFETRLCGVVLALEILALSAWIALRGMSSPPDSGSPAGIVFRALFGALVLGLIPYFALRRLGVGAQRWGAIAGIVAGVALAKYWMWAGVEYSSNLLNWYQQASSLTLLGGLRGVGTRLTLLLALLGGSLATAAGKHITIDLVTRFLKPKARVPVVIIGWIGASVVCFAAAWGFFDHIAIENFGARADERAGRKVSRVVHELGNQWFILRKQLRLDLKSTVHIVYKGEKYADWLTGTEWNDWITSSGITARYAVNRADELLQGRADKDRIAPTKIASAIGEPVSSLADMSDEVLRPRLIDAFDRSYTQTLKMDPDDRRAPMIVVPGKGEPRGELIDAANLVFPFGLLVIALRFLLRALLVISGHVGAEAEATDEHFAEAGAENDGAAVEGKRHDDGVEGSGTEESEPDAPTVTGGGTDDGAAEDGEGGG